MKTGPRRIVWIALAVLLAAAFLPGLFILHLFRRAEASLESHRVDIAALTRDIPVRRSSRPAFLQPAEEGNVWDLLRPALDEVGKLYPLEPEDRYQDASDPDLDWRGGPGETPKLIQQATPAMDQCRRAMHRSDLAWSGPIDPLLPEKIGRMARALCTRAAYAHQAGRDAEAAEWLIVALDVAQDAARLGQRKTWKVLHVVEKWVFREARLLLARHDLTVQDLAVFGHRLDVLLSARPSFGLALRLHAALQREDVLAGEAFVAVPGSQSRDAFNTVPFEETVGWKDLYSKTILRARVLNGVRSCAEELAALEWKLPLFPEVERILSRYPDPVSMLAFDMDHLSREHGFLIRRSMFRAAVAFARVQAETGRFPASAKEAGLPSDLGHPLNIKDGEIDGLSGNLEMDLVWTIKRRTKD